MKLAESKRAESVFSGLGFARVTGRAARLVVSAVFASAVFASAVFLGAARLPAAPQSGPRPLSFQEIARAEANGWREIDQRRRVLDRLPDGTTRWLVVRERLVTAPDVGGRPRFQLEFAGFENPGALSPTELTLKQQIYREHAGHLYLHGSLRVLDAQRAAQNYLLVFLENGVRVGRAVRKVAVVPLRFGIHPWILELDDATGYPLYRGEYDANGTLVSELIVTSYGEYDPNLSERARDWWEETLQSESFGTLRAATDRYPHASFHFPTPAQLPTGFALHDVRVITDDLRNEPSVVARWTDGIDQLFVVATLNALPPAFPMAAVGPHDTYALYAYRDLNTAQFMFYTDHVRHMVIGKGGQAWVGAVAYQMLTTAVTPR